MSNLTKALKTCAKKFNAEAKEIFEATQLAYSFNRYGKKAWLNSVKYLLTYFTREQTIWILKSKHMRWAADKFETARGVPLNTMEKWYADGSLDNDSEMPGRRVITKSQREFQEKMDRLDDLREQVTRLEKEIDAEYGS